MFFLVESTVNFFSSWYLMLDIKMKKNSDCDLGGVVAMILHLTWKLSYLFSSLALSQISFTLFAKKKKSEINGRLTRVYTFKYIAYS